MNEADGDDVVEGEGQPVPEGYVLDFISGKPTRATPEEVQATQVFTRRLVKDFGYPKNVIQTRPQFRVRARPSDEKASKGYPVDVAVFTSKRRLEEDAFILVECKRKTRQEGEKQLKTYLTMSPAQIGVWFNGDDHLYLHKRYLTDGTLEWVILPTIPRWGQSVEDIGSLRRGQLQVPTNLKAVFRDIRNHLAGNTTGITRDQDLAQEIIRLLFCKLYDEIDTAPDDLPRFRARVDEPADKVATRINDLFAHVKSEYTDVFVQSEGINLDPESLRYVVGELQTYVLIEATRDAIGEAFEVFIGPAVRGEEGQFFTPRNVVQMMVKLLAPQPGEMILDPACGSGGFLIVALEAIWSALENEARVKNWSEKQLEKRKREVAGRCVRGIDKDSFLTKLTKAYMAIVGDGRGGIFCEDSLNEPANWREDARSKVELGRFDVILTNPPFGSKIKVTGPKKLAQYMLARKWKKPNLDGGEWEASEAYLKDQAPQVLFVERCVQLLRPGGRLGIVLPESLFGMPIYGYFVQYLLTNFTLRAFISLPEEIFQPYTHAKTCVVILENTPPKNDYPIEMAIADWCGHDSRGNETIRVQPDGTEVRLDDLPDIANQLSKRLQWQ